MELTACPSFAAPPLTLLHCNLTGCKVKKGNFAGTTLSGCDLSKCCFSSSIFTGTSFSDCHLVGCSFSDCDLKDVVEIEFLLGCSILPKGKEQVIFSTWFPGKILPAPCLWEELNN